MPKHVSSNCYCYTLSIQTDCEEVKTHLRHLNPCPCVEHSNININNYL
jgi:hypothetical protein